MGPEPIIWSWCAAQIMEGRKETLRVWVFKKIVLKNEVYFFTVG